MQSFDMFPNLWFLIVNFQISLRFNFLIFVPISTLLFPKKEPKNCSLHHFAFQNPLPVFFYNSLNFASLPPTTFIAFLSIASINYMAWLLGLLSKSWIKGSKNPSMVSLHDLINLWTTLDSRLFHYQDFHNFI